MERYFKVEGNIIFPNKEMLTWGPFYYHSETSARNRMDDILNDITAWCNEKDPSLGIKPESLIRTSGNTQIVFTIKAWKDEKNLEQCNGIITVDDMFFEDEDYDSKTGLKEPEKILSYGRVIKEGDTDFIPKKFSVEAVEAARLEVAEFFVNLSGIFGHYAFFTEELWRKVKGFKKHDKAEIIAAFLHREFHNKYGFNTCPCGCGWFANLDEDSYNDYIKKYEPVFEAYKQWQIKQR